MHEGDKPTQTIPAPSRDVLTAILHDGAQRLLGQAIEAEGTNWIDRHAEVVDDRGRRQVVRNGHHPARTLVTGLGPVQVTQRRVHDRRPADAMDEHARPVERFRSKILPPYLRKTRAIEELIPWLYLKGVSSGDFGEALQALVGPQAAGLSASTITRLLAMVRLRHRRTKGNDTRVACLTMVFKLMESAARKWRALNGTKLLPDVIAGVAFIDGEKAEKDAA